MLPCFIFCVGPCVRQGGCEDELSGIDHASGTFLDEPGLLAATAVRRRGRCGHDEPCDDLVVNVTVAKKLTNMRASGSDEKTSIAPAIKFSLEEAMEYIGDDEYLEVTPQSLRLRKILLGEIERKRASKS